MRFQGSGRGNVEFHVIKNFAESLSQRIVPQDLDGMRAGARDAHGRRHPPCRQEARTRGGADACCYFSSATAGPMIGDHGRDANDQEYAVNDTRQALREAVRRKIRPFCLTIDKEGADDMRAIV